MIVIGETNVAVKELLEVTRQDRLGSIGRKKWQQSHDV